MKKRCNSKMLIDAQSVDIFLLLKKVGDLYSESKQC